MQYPLEKLSSFITHQHTASAQIPPQQFEVLCRMAQYDICVYMSTAQTEQQAAFMLHALKVAILGMQNTVHNGTQQTEHLPEHYDQNNAHAIDSLDQLRAFLDEQFASFINYPLPASFRKDAIGQQEKPAIQTSLSVPQLGLFIRLLVETGILEDGKNIAALTTRIAGSFKTRKTQQISSESLRIKYYTPDKAAVNIVKEILFRMIGLLGKF